MALTRDFEESVMARAERDPAFRTGLLTEAVECLLAGELEVGKILLRDCVNATVGFKELAWLTKRKDSSLMRMLGPKGNPAMSNLFEIIVLLQAQEGVNSGSGRTADGEAAVCEDVPTRKAVAQSPASHAETAWNQGSSSSNR